MDANQVQFAVAWTRRLLEPKQRHPLVARAVARMSGASEGLTLYEVAQRCSPPMFSALFDPPIIGELFLAELLTWEQGSDTILLPSTLKESCDESDCERV